MLRDTELFERLVKRIPAGAQTARRTRQRAGGRSANERRQRAGVGLCVWCLVLVLHRPIQATRLPDIARLLIPTTIDVCSFGNNYRGEGKKPGFG